MDFLMDENGDLAIVDGDLALVTGVDATVQFLVQSLRLFLSEWFLDETAGFPYYDEVFVKNPNPAALDSLFKTYIIDLPGVEQLLDFSLNFDVSTRQLTITGVIQAFDGEADFSVATILPGGT